MDRKKLGQRLRDLRKVMPLTQHELADRSGVSYGAIQDIEAAKGNPQLETIETIEKTLGLPLIQLYGERVPLGPLIDFRERYAANDPPPIDLPGAADLLGRLAAAPDDIQKLILAIAHREPSHLASASQAFRRKAIALLKAVLEV